jgi:hypothetical protein
MENSGDLLLMLERIAKMNDVSHPEAKIRITG